VEKLNSGTAVEKTVKKKDNWLLKRALRGNAELVKVKTFLGTFWS
jgi:hypothetical protein